MVLITFALLYNCPGRVLISLYITWSLVLSFPTTEILLKYAGLPSLILTSRSITFPSALTSTGVTDENK